MTGKDRRKAGHALAQARQQGNINRELNESAQMALPIRDQVKYWGISTAILLILLWAMGDVLLPFLVGGAAAYFLDPIADRLERLGLSRTAATAVIALVVVLMVVMLTLAIIPTLINQLAALVNAAPEIVKKMEGFFMEHFPELTDSTSTIRQTMASIGKQVQESGAKLATGALSSALGVVSIVVFMLVVPVVAFYLLLDWDQMIARIDELLPRDHAPVIRRIGREVDTVLAGFVRGQLTVCMILGTYYAISLMLAGLQFGGIIGAIAGTITFIPYVGALVGGALAIGLALFQFWGDWSSIALVTMIFAFGQFLEGNVLTPKLVGKSVGLHPVWLLLALSLFGSLFGFVGMLVAVPVSAVFGVLVRFAVEQYRDSVLFTGHGSAPDPAQPDLGGPYPTAPAPSPKVMAIAEALVHAQQADGAATVGVPVAIPAARLPAAKDQT